MHEKVQVDDHDILSWYCWWSWYFSLIHCDHCILMSILLKQAWPWCQYYYLTGLALPLYPAQPALLSDTAALCAGEPLHVISIALFRTGTSKTFITIVHCENITIIILTITIISISAPKKTSSGMRELLCTKLSVVCPSSLQDLFPSNCVHGGDDDGDDEEW